MFRLCLGLAALLAAAAAPCAATAAQRPGNLPTQAEFSAPVPGGGGRTWADLTLLVFPDARSELQIRRAAEAADPSKGFAEPVYLPERRIADTIAPPRPLAARFAKVSATQQRYHIDRVNFLAVMGGGKPLLAALYGGASENFAVMALFEQGPQGKLLDVVNVRNDRSTYFWDAPALRLTAGSTAFALISSHDSHTVTYQAHALIYVRDGRFAEVGAFGMYQSHLDCSEEIARSAAYRARPAGDRSHALIEAVITTTQRVRPADCAARHYKPSLTQTHATASWRWNAATQTYDAHIPEDNVLEPQEGSLD